MEGGLRSGVRRVARRPHAPGPARPRPGTSRLEDQDLVASVIDDLATVAVVDVEWSAGEQLRLRRTSSVPRRSHPTAPACCSPRSRRRPRPTGREHQRDDVRPRPPAPSSGCRPTTGVVDAAGHRGADVGWDGWGCRPAWREGPAGQSPTRSRLRRDRPERGREGRAALSWSVSSGYGGAVRGLRRQRAAWHPDDEPRGPLAGAAVDLGGGRSSRSPSGVLALLGAGAAAGQGPLGAHPTPSTGDGLASDPGRPTLATGCGSRGETPARTVGKSHEVASAGTLDSGRSVADGILVDRVCHPSDPAHRGGPHPARAVGAGGVGVRHRPGFRADPAGAAAVRAELRRGRHGQLDRGQRVRVLPAALRPGRRAAHRPVRGAARSTSPAW